MWSETSTSQQRHQRQPPVSAETGRRIGAHVWRRTGLHRCSSPGNANENTPAVERRVCMRTTHRSELAVCLHQVSRAKGMCTVRVGVGQYHMFAFKRHRETRKNSRTPRNVFRASYWCVDYSLHSTEHRRECVHVFAAVQGFDC